MAKDILPFFGRDETISFTNFFYKLLLLLHTSIYFLFLILQFTYPEASMIFKISLILHKKNSRSICKDWLMFLKPFASIYQ